MDAGRFFVVMMLVCSQVDAQVYKWVDEKGVTHYGDKPVESRKAQSVKIREAPPEGRLQPAQWKKMGEQERSLHYLDVSNVRKKGSIREVWTMVDYKVRFSVKVEGQSKPLYTIASSRAHQEFDCETSRARNLEVTNYSGAMGTGSIETEDDFVASGRSNWINIEPGTSGETIRKFVC